MRTRPMASGANQRHEDRADAQRRKGSPTAKADPYRQHEAESPECLDRGLVERAGRFDERDRRVALNRPVRGGGHELQLLWLCGQMSSTLTAIRRSH